MKGIEAIQQQYIYRVNPVNLFERRTKQNVLREQPNIFASSNSQFNLNHPNVIGNSGMAESLDLLA